MSVWEDWKADFRDGYGDAQRDVQEQRGMFDQPGDAVEREREFYWQQGVPARRPPADESRLRALVDLCNQRADTVALREAEIAECAARLDEYVSALAERDAENARLAGRLDQYAAALAGRDGQIRALIDELTSETARGDRFKANGKKLMDKEVAPLRAHIEALCKLGWQAMSKATHPDTGPAGDRAARDELFKLVNTIFEKR